MKNILLNSVYIILALTLCIPTSLSAQGSNLTLTDILTGSELGLVAVEDHLTDVWGYYDAATQKEYAIVGKGDKGTTIIELTNSGEFSDNRFTIPSALSYDVKTWNNYLFIANERGDTLGSTDDDILIYDLADGGTGKP